MEWQRVPYFRVSCRHHPRLEAPSRGMFSSLYPPHIPLLHMSFFTQPHFRLLLSLLNSISNSCLQELTKVQPKRQKIMGLSLKGKLPADDVSPPPCSHLPHSFFFSFSSSNILFMFAGYYIFAKCKVTTQVYYDGYCWGANPCSCHCCCGPFNGIHPSSHSCWSLNKKENKRRKKENTKKKDRRSN